MFVSHNQLRQAFRESVQRPRVQLLVQSLAGEAASKTPAKAASSLCAAARSASLDPGSAISVAVMPFANLSTHKAEEFFSEGMTDEIAGSSPSGLGTNRLAHNCAGLTDRCLPMLHDEPGSGRGCAFFRSR
jgi:hypothetical protein